MPIMILKGDVPCGILGLSIDKNTVEVNCFVSDSLYDRTELTSFMFSFAKEYGSKLRKEK